MRRVLILLFLMATLNAFAYVEVGTVDSLYENVKDDKTKSFYIHKIVLNDSKTRNAINLSKTYYKNKKTNYYINVFGQSVNNASILSRLDMRFDNRIVRLSITETYSKDYAMKDESIVSNRSGMINLGDSSKIFDMILACDEEFAFQIAYQSNQPSDVYVIAGDDLKNLKSSINKLYKKGFKLR